MKRFYLNVPYADKDKVKSLGARWDNDVRKWYYEGVKEDRHFSLWQMKEALTYEELSDEQKAFIDLALTGKNVLVDACIGSGKTTAIQVLCNTIHNKNILYLTYNRLLKLDAQDKIMSSNVIVQNYHGFAYEVLKGRYDQNVTLGIPDLIQTFNHLKPDVSGIDLLILDEYQDIEQELAEMLEIIKSCNPDMQIVAVGDLKQKIYDKTTLSVPAFISKYLGTYKTLHFTKCFRLNAELASRLGKIWDKKINGVNKDCKVRKMSVREVTDYIAEQKLSDILCLGARTGSMSYVLNELEELYPEKFNKKTVYASISDEDRGCVQPSSSNAIFTTFDGSKGLERPICFIFDYTSDYWNTRLDMPMTDYSILRNIFCVAASRGKKEIIFVKGRNSIVTDEELSTPKAKNETFRSFYISEMFSFKYREDVESCYKLIKKRKIKGEKNVIDINNSDAMIDLAPCIGIYQEAGYFKNYDIDSEIEFSQLMHSDRPPLSYDENAGLQEKILYLTAYETYQDRYLKQVKAPFISKEQSKMINSRLANLFTRDEQVQRRCSLLFRDEGGNIIEAEGRADVIKDGCVYELKFCEDVTHEHFLQLGCYMVALGISKGVLWNTRNNERYEVRVPDRKKFLDAVVKCITKGNISQFYCA